MNLVWFHSPKCQEYSDLEKLQVFERLVVARTATTWRTADGSVRLQIANPSGRGVKVPKGLTLAFLSTSTVTKKNEKQVSAVAALPENLDELVAARVALEPTLAEAFADTTFTPEQITEVIQLCAKYRPVSSLSPDELGCCNVAEATFPLPPGTVPLIMRHTVPHPMFKRKLMNK